MTDLEQVLGLVNSARTALGMGPIESLPRGRKGSSADCVLARSLGMSFGNRSAWAVMGHRRQRRTTAAALAAAWDVHAGMLNRRSVQLPETLRDFITCFDAGDFPDLVDAGASVGEAGEAGDAEGVEGAEETGILVGASPA